MQDRQEAEDDAEGDADAEGLRIVSVVASRAADRVVACRGKRLCRQAIARTVVSEADGLAIAVDGVAVASRGIAKERRVGRVCSVKGDGLPPTCTSGPRWASRAEWCSQPGWRRSEPP